MSDKPAPFYRPSIDLDKVNRQWSTVFVDKVEVDDIVVDVGLIIKIENDEEVVILTNAIKETSCFLKDDRVQAFVKR